MDDVITPQLTPSFDVEAEKPLAVVEQEAEQKVAEKKLKAEIEHPHFPIIRSHFEELVENYNDIRTLADLKLTGVKFEVAVRTKAAIVAELKDFLDLIDRVIEPDKQVDGGDES